MPSTPDSSLPAYVVRRLQPSDAPGVVACFRAVYGDSYVHPELYDAAAIVRLNLSQQLSSVVALAAGGEVVAHYAIEEPTLRRIAETGEALVAPAHRHHHLMEEMRTVIESLAVEHALIGLYGNVVTNHLFSQQTVERFGTHPCGLSLGWSPRTFHNMPEQLPQRMSEVLYFKYVEPPQPVTVHLPARHAAWCRRLSAPLGVSWEERSAEAPRGETRLAITRRRDLGRAVIHVETVGEATAEEIGCTARSLAERGAEAIFLELPLAQPGTPAVCEAVERFGFFFSGLAPSFSADGDTLRMTWLGVEIDPSLMQLANPLAAELLQYMVQERGRVTVRERKPTSPDLLVQV